jgi:hypothetical protein
MSLAPALSIRLGNLRYGTHTAGARICLSLLPRCSSAQIALPSHVRFEAAPGDAAELSIDGGEGAQTALTGKVRSIRRTFDQIVVTVADGAAELAAYRPSDTYEGQNAKAIASALASDVALDTATIDIDLDLGAFVAHPGRTAAEHIADLALLAGGIAYVGGDGALNVRRRPAGPADAALKYGRDVTAFDEASADTVNPQRFAIGFGGAGSGSAPDVLRPSVDAIPASAPTGGLGVRRVSSPVLRVPSAATTASSALQTAAAAQAKRVTAEGFLLAALRPASVIEVQALPDGLSSGPWLVTRVEHSLEGGAGSTRFWAETADAAPSSLLAGLAGALGSLL